MSGPLARIVGHTIGSRNNCCHCIESLEPRSLLSAYSPSATVTVATDTVASGAQIELSGTFAHFTSTAKAGKKFVESVKVTNSGSQTASGLLPVVVQTSPDGLLSDATALTTINKNIKIKAGKSVTIPLALTAPAEASSFYLVVQLDPNDTLGNETLTNNTFASSGRVNVKTRPFTLGSIVGQNGWSLLSTSGPASTAIVTTSVTPPARGNKQTIVLNRAAGQFIGVAPLAAVSSASPFTVTAQVQVNYKTTANGPFFGLNLYGNNGAVELGTLDVNASDGDIYDYANGQGTFLLSDGSAGSPAPIMAGTWNTFKIVASFSGGAGGPVTLNYYLNGTLVDTETSASASAFAYAYIWSQTGIGATGDAAGTAAFDDYSLTTTAPSTLPQPNGLTFP